MEKTAGNEGFDFKFHTVLGTYCISYSIFLILKIYVPGFYEEAVQMGAFSWLIIYGLATSLLLMAIYTMSPLKREMYTAYFTLIGCCECIAFTGMVSPDPETASALIPLTAIPGAVFGYFAGICNLPKSKKMNSPFCISGIISAIIHGLIIGLIITPVICLDGSEDAVQAFICFIASVMSSILIYAIRSFLHRINESKTSASYEAEREQVMKEQDLYDKRCAKNRAEKAAKEKAEKEARERERKERERQERERRERERKQREEQNRRSSGNSSSRRGSYTGSWNKTADSYFKDCKNKEELKRRYRQLCKKLHPDNPGGNTESFRQMQSEYESLRRKMAG